MYEIQQQQQEQNPKKDNRIRRMNTNWSSLKIQKLIDEVHKQESLWNVATHAYKGRDRKELSWDCVTVAVGESKSECKVKWNAMRVAYRVCINKLKN